MSFDLHGDLTLLDLVLVVQEFTRSEWETVEVVAALLESGHVRIRSSAIAGPERMLESVPPPEAA